MRAGFLTPALGRPTGGSLYNSRVVAAWPPGAVPVELVEVPDGPARGGGDSGRGDGAGGDREQGDGERRLEEALRRYPVAIVDGLLGSQYPGAIERAAQAGHRAIMLVHMAAPAQAGLNPAERERRAALEARALAAAAAVVSPSTWGARDLARRYGIRGAVVATPGTEAAPVACGSDPAQVLVLGAVGPGKNQLLAVRAAARVAHRPFRLRLVGPTVDREYAAQLGAEARAAGVPTAGPEGPLEGGALEELLAATDLLVSVASHETYGMVVTEALARGIPAIVGAGTGAEEALGAGMRAEVLGAGTGAEEALGARGVGSLGTGEAAAVGGLPGTAVSTTDPDELAAALEGWLTDPATRATWRERALWARAGLTGWDVTARTLADVVGKLETPAER